MPHMKKRNGKFLCERLGASCDFIVEDEDMEEVVQWISENINFDKIYFYGNDRPIHVSYFPEPSNQITFLCTSSK